ncbi:hypothetical protein B0T18DRAFT_403355 [Schizothecium vesticola]|uniref:Chromo domain-containing protein n=1 Tax=Schizothecium vesticola TaxID=314040 RepID=A0AA40F643_9PEZI|nr:hypothetical protein B0T18DRAFT_403355 [Schizothecium vesticola]
MRPESVIDYTSPQGPYPPSHPLIASAMAGQPSPPRRRPKTTIEVPVLGFRKYVGGMGPPLEPLSLAPPRDSTAYIIEKLVWPPIKETTPTMRRLLYYHIGFTDLPHVKTMVSCNDALDYISPREIEDWEYNDLERRIEEKEWHKAEKKAGKRRAGRPAKSLTSDAAPILAARASVTDDAMLLAEHVAGPSLSTPKKRKRQEEEEITTSESDDAAIRRQLGAWSESAGTGTGRENETGQEDESVGGVDMIDMTASRRSTSQSLPPLRPAAVPVEGSSRASSVASAVRESSRRSTPHSTPSGQQNSTKPLSLTALRPPAAAPPKPKPSPAIHAPVAASSSSTLHPASATALGIKDGTASPLHPQSKNGHAQRSNTVTPTPKTGSFNPQNQPRVHGFTPIPSSNPRPPKTFPSMPTTPAEASDSTSSNRKSGSSKKSKAKAKTPAKSAEKKPAKKKVKGRVAKTRDDDESDADDNVWKVKALLDDRYDHTKEGKVHMFLVDWVGDYDPTWEPKENIQDDNLISEYQRRKRAGLTQPDKSQRSMLSYLSKSPFANVNDAFEGNIVDPDKALMVGTRSDRSHSGDELLVVDQRKAPTSNGKSTARPAPKPASQPPPPLFGSFDRTLASNCDRFGEPV